MFSERMEPGNERLMFWPVGPTGVGGTVDEGHSAPSSRTGQEKGNVILKAHEGRGPIHRRQGLPPGELGDAKVAAVGQAKRRQNRAVGFEFSQPPAKSRIRGFLRRSQGRGE